MFCDLQILMSVLVGVPVIRMQSVLTLQAATPASVSQTTLEMAIPVKVNCTLKYNSGRLFFEMFQTTMDILLFF